MNDSLSPPASSIDGDEPNSTVVPPLKGAKRFIVAYWVTLKVVLSYLWIRFLARFWSKEEYEDRLSELNRRNAQLVESTILRLQGLFIKVGQLFSIMTNLFPPEFRHGLEKLQDKMPERPYAEISGRIQEEFGSTPEDLFAEFNRKPIASASLGQAHRARLKTGEDVVVKVQHLGVDEAVRLDLRAIKRILQIVQFFIDVRGLDNYYQEIREMIGLELDFNQEARHIDAIAANFTDDPKLHFPKVYHDYSTSRVLTMSFMEGVKITNIDAIREMGLDRSQLAKDIVTMYCQMIFVDGIYHADPHPGNILVQNDGSMALIDFGAVGHLSEQMRKAIGEFVEGVLARDTNRIMHSIRDMGFISQGGGAEEVSEKVIEHFHRRFQEEIRIEKLSLSEIKVDPSRGLETLSGLRRMDIGLRELSEAFILPKDWVLLERALLLLTGLCTFLDPTMNPTEIIQPYLEEFVLGKDRDWSQMALQVAKDTVLSYLSIPADLQKYLTKTLRGELKFQIRNLDRAARLVYAGIRQLAYAFGGLTFSVLHYVLKIHNDTLGAEYTSYAAIGFGVLFLGSVLFARRHHGR